MDRRHLMIFFPLLLSGHLVAVAALMLLEGRRRKKQNRMALRASAWIRGSLPMDASLDPGGRSCLLLSSAAARHRCTLAWVFGGKILAETTV
jgi:hypothetical protein